MLLVEQERDIALRELLRDLGWLPGDLNCDEKRRLADDYLEATKSWFDLGKGMRRDLLERLRHSHKVPARDYQDLNSNLDQARRKTARARLALEAHIAAHRC